MEAKAGNQDKRSHMGEQKHAGWMQIKGVTSQIRRDAWGRQVATQRT